MSRARMWLDILMPVAFAALVLASLAGCAGAAKGAAAGIGAGVASSPPPVLPPPDAGLGGWDVVAYGAASIVAYAAGSFVKGWIRARKAKV